jgi:ABC-2 type transport system permease protein
MSKQLFYRTGRLIRLVLRLDRIRLPVWIIVLTLATPLLALLLDDLYPTDAERQILAEAMLNPAMTALVGPGYGMEAYSFGALFAHQMLILSALVIGIMSILLVARHTRGDEEEGRIEMIRSLPVGRLSNLGAVLGVMGCVYILLALTTALGLYGLNMESISLEGAALYGAVLGATGMFFSALTAFVAQLSQHSRGVLGLSFAVLLFSYMLRAIGDVNNETVSLLSPLGWVHRTEVFVNNLWWPVVLLLSFAVLFAILSIYFNSKRDLESGLLPTRPGRKYASTFLQSPLGLALRLQRTGLIAWAVALLLIGSTYGSVLGDLDSFIAEVELMQEMLPPLEGVTLVEQYLALLMSVIAIACSIPVLMALLKVKGEEKHGRIEHILSRAVSRTRLLGSYLFISIVTSILMISLAAVGLGATAAAVVEESPEFGSILSAAFAYLPAMWIMIGFTMLLIGYFPKRTGLTWLYIAFCFLMVYLGGLLQFPDWLLNLSPYQHVPSIPLEEASLFSFMMLTLVAFAMIIAGFFGFNRRDIQV